MLIGVGTDILRVSDILSSSLKENDPFFKKTYASMEVEQAKKREVPAYYYATRFAGKEAVFKCLGIHSDGVSLNEIVIIDDENGQPHVTLEGRLKELACEKNIAEILISLSYDKDYAVAYAAAQSV